MRGNTAAVSHTSSWRGIRQSTGTIIDFPCLNI